MWRIKCFSFCLGVYFARTQCSLESAPLTRLPQLPTPASQNCRETPFGQLLPLASSQLKKKKKKSYLSLKEKLGESCVPYAQTGQQLPSICSGVVQRAPFLKKLIEAGVCCAWYLCVCVCVRCVCVCDMRTQDLFLSDSPLPHLPFPSN